MFQVLVLLSHDSASVDSFRKFELKALAIVRSHGGRLISAFAPDKAGDENAPDEIHLLEFPSQKAFEAYRVDERTIAMAEERAAIISATRVYTSAEIISYDDR